MEVSADLGEQYWTGLHPTPTAARPTQRPLLRAGGGEANHSTIAWSSMLLRRRLHSASTSVLRRALLPVAAPPALRSPRLTQIGQLPSPLLPANHGLLSGRCCSNLAGSSSTSEQPPPITPPLASDVDDGDEDGSDQSNDTADGKQEEEKFPLLLSHMRPPKDTSRKYIKVDEKGRAYATGRRKTAVARVWVWPNKLEDETPSLRINKMSLSTFFGGHWSHRYTVIEPFLKTGTWGKYHVMATARAGITGQAEAVRLGIATALQGLAPELRPAMKQAGFLKRDPRSRERKKPGQAGARKKFAWVKR